MIKKYHLPNKPGRFFISVGCVLLAALLFSSCKVYKPAYYFKDITRDTIIRGFEPKNLELVIQKSDVLAINVSSLNPAEDDLFIKTADPGAKGFLVDEEGNIFLHRIGKMSVAGLTRKQLKQQLETSLLPFLKDPIATVNFVNHRITVFGEISSQVIEMPEEKIALLEVLARSNPATVNSKLDQVMIIRESPGAKEFKHLNLQDFSIITSPWYYLQPNDIVVVKPNVERILDEAKRTRNQLMYTTLLSGITFVFLIIDRVFR